MYTNPNPHPSLKEVQHFAYKPHVAAPLTYIEASSRSQRFASHAYLGSGLELVGKSFQPILLACMRSGVILHAAGSSDTVNVNFIDATGVWVLCAVMSVVEIRRRLVQNCQMPVCRFNGPMRKVSVPRSKVEAERKMV
jgi:acyl transferase domain-containing protein